MTEPIQLPPGPNLSREVGQKTEPIRPDQVKPTKPDEVIEIFNNLIQKAWDGEQARVLQRDAVALIEKEMDISEKEILSKKYLDIESVYEMAGW